MALKIAINGMGVIGRELFKTLWGKEGIEIVFLSDMGINPANLAYLLKYDSIYHDNFCRDNITAEEYYIRVDGKDLRLYNEYDVNNLPLGECGIDFVLECTGNLNSQAQLQGFINAGARKVISCYQCGNDLPTIAHNVNNESLKSDTHIISFPQMESQVAATVLKIINDYCTISCGMIKAFRSFTNAQPTMDSYVSGNFARGRAASTNITPVSDGFANSIGLTIPELNGKFKGFTYRSPVINGSIMDFTIKTERKDITSENINACLKAASSERLGYNEEAICSSDALAFDLPLVIAQRTLALPDNDGILINISVAYDNVRGYCNQMARFLKWAENGWDY